MNNSNKLNYRYETIEIGSLDIHVRSLRDVQEFQDKENEAKNVGINDAEWSLFGVLWPSSFVLAIIMEQMEINELHILEVGCGLALSSLVLKMRDANISVTDYNPAVEDFLKENTRINKCGDIQFLRADWENEEMIPNKRYDLIIGSDILYQRNHSKQLSRFINKYAKEKSKIIVVDPNRGQQNNFIREMKSYRFSHHKDNKIHHDKNNNVFKGRVHHFSRN